MAQRGPNIRQVYNAAMDSRMERTYIALVHKDPGSDDGVSFPDLPGCVAACNSLEETCKTARKTLASHLARMSAGGYETPTPNCASYGEPAAAQV